MLKEENNVVLARDKLHKDSLYEPYFEKDNCGMGFVASIKNEKSNDIVQQGIQVLKGLEHRGAEGYDENTGDGAGLLFEIPHEFFQDIVEGLPEKGDYGVANIFFPTLEEEYVKIKGIIKEEVEKSKDKFLCWREVPVNPEAVGVQARSSLPRIVQLFIERENSSEEDFKKISIY